MRAALENGLRNTAHCAHVHQNGRSEIDPQIIKQNNAEHRIQISEKSHNSDVKNLLYETGNRPFRKVSEYGDHDNARNNRRHE